MRPRDSDGLTALSRNDVIHGSDQAILTHFAATLIQARFAEIGQVPVRQDSRMRPGVALYLWSLAPSLAPRV